MSSSGGPRSYLAWLVVATASLVLASCMVDPRLPAPPDVYENVGAVDDFPVGVTRIGDDAWLIKTTTSVRAFVEKPGCANSLQGTRLVDCRGQEINLRPSGVAPENASPGPPYFDMQAALCTWVYPPAGDVWVYFESWPGRSPRYDSNGNDIDDPSNRSPCPGMPTSGE